MRYENTHSSLEIKKIKKGMVLFANSLINGIMRNVTIYK